MAGLGNYNYVRNVPVQQDQFVDNRNTIGTVPVFGNSIVDKYDQMAKDQALVDATPDIALAGAPSLVMAPTRQAIRFGTHGRELVDIGKAGFDRMKVMKEGQLARPYTKDEIMLGSFRPLERNIKRVSRGYEPGQVSPAYFEKDVTHTMDVGNMGSYMHRSTPNGPSLIANNKRRQTPLGLGLTKRHEYNHNFWQKKYGGFDDDLIQPEYRIDPRLGGDNMDYVRYLAEPAEINARSREMQHLMSKVRKNGETPEVISEMERLRDVTEPFIKKFNKRYPDEMGKHMENGINYLFERDMKRKGKEVRDDVLDMDTLRMLERLFSSKLVQGK